MAGTRRKKQPRETELSSVCLLIKRNKSFSLKRNEPRRVGGTNTGPTVLHRFVADRKLSQVVTDHFWLDFNLVERLPIVNTNYATNHLRNYDHVAKVSPHWFRFFTWWRFPFRFPELLDQCHGLALQTPAEPSTNTSREELDELIGGNVKQGIKIDTSVAELPERSLLWLPRCCNIFNVRHCRAREGKGEGDACECDD
uniref:Uncharacterized protein n=1 Tax=Opuntia streptacantha TaxID=393608 RepID=A0A7C9DTU2_OPUST